MPCATWLPCLPSLPLPPLSLYLDLLNLTRNLVRAVTAALSSGYTDRSIKYRGRSSCSVLLSWGVGTQGSRISLADHTIPSTCHRTSSHGFFFERERETDSPHNHNNRNHARVLLSFCYFPSSHCSFFFFQVSSPSFSLSLSPPRPLSLSAFAS